MKNIFVSFLLLTTSAISQAQNSTQLHTCTVTEKTVLRSSDETIEAGSLAVTRDGTPVTLKEILADAMIYFKGQDGRVSTSYQWMYNPIQPVLGRSDKYLSSSFGEDVIVTVGHHTDKPHQTSIRYVGTRSGEYLSLVCLQAP